MIQPNRIVLHIDDDPDMTRLIAARLQPLGFDVQPLNDPRRAIDTMLQRQVHVVLVDIQMPDLDGLELLRQIKAHDGGIQVIIILTGQVSLSVALKSLRWGAEACFFKPVGDLQPMVEALGDTFRKIDRWWASLDQLRKLQQEATPANAATFARPAVRALP